MTIIRFPNSVGIGNNGGRAENSHHEVKRPRLIGNARRNSDIVDISIEAKRRYEKDNLIKLERVRLFREAEEYTRILDGIINLKEADMRNIYRPERVQAAKGKLDSGFYDIQEDYVLKKMLAKPEI